MKNEVIFLGASDGSRGGLKVGINLISKEKFLESVDKWHERIELSSYISYPKWRYAFVDGDASKLFKNMTVSEFEQVFTDRDILRLGRLLEYNAKNYDKYPVFLKAIYLKYGFERTE